MSIKPSAAAEIRTLVESLSAADDVKREAAIARLVIIGSRAVDRLLAAYANPAMALPARIAILRVLEAIGDPRAIRIARAALHEGSDLGAAAAGVLRALLEAPAPGTSAEALDALVATALDRTAERRVRLAALDALQDMPGDVRARVAKALEDDPDPAIPKRFADSKDAATADAVWQEAVEGRLPDEPAALREAVQLKAPAAPLGVLQKMVDAVRAREMVGGGDARAHEWRAVRGALHQALALRGSKVAVYDLRETLEAAGEPLPPTFLAALHVVGDESCLQPIATAFGRAAGNERWQHQLEAAFNAIVKREKLGRKSAARLLSTTSRTTPRPKTRRRT